MRPSTAPSTPAATASVWRNKIISSLPQVVEADTPQTQDASGEFVLYDEFMTRVFIADALPEERSALRLVVQDLHLEVIGEAADWPTTLAQAPSLRPDMLLIDWTMLPDDTQSAALAILREKCPGALVIVLISHLDARQQAALSSGADTFISKGETPERVADRIRSVAAGIRPA
jgi:DNA-binding NarL/FixJ family response regulator